MTKLFKILIGLACAWLGAGAIAAVDVNKASADELQQVKGIGPAMSAKIVEARKAAPFKDWADLQSRVSGIGGQRAAKLADEGLVVNGTGLTSTGKKPEAAEAAVLTPAKAVPTPPATSAKPAPAPAASSAKSMQPPLATPAKTMPAKP